MKRFSSAFLLFASLPVLAAVPPARTVVSLDSGSGSVEFKAIGHPSSLKVIGKGSKPTGRFEINGTHASGEAVFDLASLDTGIDMRDRHMKERYLEVGKYPQAKLKIQELTLPQPLAANTSVSKVPFTGTLILHGVEKPVSGTADIEDKGSQVRINAHFGLRIADYGIAKPSFSGITLADEVQVEVQSESPIQLGGAKNPS